MATGFNAIADVKRQRVQTAFPTVIGKQVEQASMPYKSDAQRKFFHTPSAVKAGITPAQVKEFDAASKGKKLPEKVAPRRRVKFPKP